ncbi:YbaB/EbfC family nucleoid-associated protein [Nocardia flavorosea]|uniref:YbaB/EbfC family nucleoid-associated protein n=1 Tax=Nocardia flavorosea TaxID=53429 RepID=UPI0018955632|nr:YbaB/EbfC family nucleoid-associated protein [Nocardia flavorosea]MBF6351219.1 YbaB/EbfC family nucleoid-associated protein [Nocardia flavorosea]
MSDDPSVTAAGLARWAEQMQQKAQRFQVLQGRLAQLSVTETSGDNSVRVTVDSNGVPTDIRFTDGIRRRNPAALSTDVMACLSRARAALGREVTATVHEVVGDDPIGATIIEQFADRLADPATTPGLPHPAPSAPQSTPPQPGSAAPAPIWSDQPNPAPSWNRPAGPGPIPNEPQPNRPAASRPASARPEPTHPAPAPPPPTPPAPGRNQPPPPPPATPTSLIPDVEDEEGEYYRNKSWLV